MVSANDRAYTSFAFWSCLMLGETELFLGQIILFKWNRCATSPFRNIILRTIHYFFFALNISKFCSHLVEEFVIPSLHVMCEIWGVEHVTGFFYSLQQKDMVSRAHLSHWYCFALILVIKCHQVFLFYYSSLLYYTVKLTCTIWAQPQPTQLLSAAKRDHHRISQCDYLWSFWKITFYIHCHSSLRISYERFTESCKGTLRGFFFLLFLHGRAEAFQ